MSLTKQKEGQVMNKRCERYRRRFTWGVRMEGRKKERGGGFAGGQGTHLHTCTCAKAKQARTRHMGTGADIEPPKRSKQHSWSAGTYPLPLSFHALAVPSPFFFQSRFWLPFPDPWVLFPSPTQNDFETQPIINLRQK
jgi:hypothetical protein